MNLGSWDSLTKEIKLPDEKAAQKSAAAAFQNRSSFARLASIASNWLKSARQGTVHVVKNSSFAASTTRVAQLSISSSSITTDRRGAPDGSSIQ